MIRNLILTLAIPFILSNSIAISQAQKTKVLVEITNLRNDEGLVGLGVYTNNEDFKEEDEYLLKQFPKEGMQNGRLVVELWLPPGTYGIAMLDDENRNGEMDFGWVLPEEGFGFSNYVHSGLTRPDFDEFSFTVGATPTKVSVQVKYM